MPTINVKENDTTTNLGKTTLSQYILIVDNKATELSDKVPAEITEIGQLTYSGSETALYTVSERTYNFVDEALSLGGNIILAYQYDDATVDYISDRNQFDVKFLLVDEIEDTEDTTTTDDDGNPTQPDLEAAISIADTRKDCVIILSTVSTTLQESTQKLCRKNVSYIDDDFFKDEKARVNGKYIGAFYGVFDDITAGQGYVLAFLNSVSLSSSNAWKAISGSTRGAISGHTITNVVSEKTLALMQRRTTSSHDAAEAPISVNPILSIKNVGDRIWGNRTCLPNANVLEQIGENTYQVDTDADQLIASSFLNTRLLLADIKKALYRAYIACDFEQDTDETWVKFTSIVENVLDVMKSDRLIQGYKWKEVESSKRATIVAILRIKPVEAVEDFDVTIEIGDTLEVSTTE